MSKYNKCIPLNVIPMMHDPDEEWLLEMHMGIDEIRLLYDHICYSIETWPGSPRRPPEEQEYLHIMKNRLFAMIMEYNLEFLDTK
tara:strand:- start:488 stop:742 length:255 start_codon:yes stop_codon:yes gene_type:complete